MKVYKLEIMIIDFDKLERTEIIDVIESTSYLNPRVMDLKVVEIGEWEDNNPLNHYKTSYTEYKRLFT